MTAPRIMPPKNERPSNFLPESFDVCLSVLCAGFIVGGVADVLTWADLVILTTEVDATEIEVELADFKAISLVLETIKKKTTMELTGK